jgi:hypothetical protein
VPRVPVRLRASSTVPAAVQSMLAASLALARPPCGVPRRRTLYAAERSCAGQWRATRDRAVDRRARRPTLRSARPRRSTHAAAAATHAPGRAAARRAEVALESGAHELLQAARKHEVEARRLHAAAVRGDRKDHAFDVSQAALRRTCGALPGRHWRCRGECRLAGRHQCWQQGDLPLPRRARLPEDQPAGGRQRDQRACRSYTISAHTTGVNFNTTLRDFGRCFVARPARTQRLVTPRAWLCGCARRCRTGR